MKYLYIHGYAELLIGEAMSLVDKALRILEVGGAP